MRGSRIVLTLAVLCACRNDEFLANRLPQQSRFIPGTTYLGRNNYIEYIAGNAPVILTAPHGGVVILSEAKDLLSLPPDRALHSRDGALQ